MFDGHCPYINSPIFAVIDNNTIKARTRRARANFVEENDSESQPWLNYFSCTSGCIGVNVILVIYLFIMV
jgi:hypothetical protein